MEIKHRLRDGEPKKKKEAEKGEKEAFRQSSSEVSHCKRSVWELAAKIGKPKIKPEGKAELGGENVEEVKRGETE